MLRYLSLDWINELTAHVAASEHLHDLAGAHQIGVTQVVSDGPEGDVTYHLQVGDGQASFGAGVAEPEDVAFIQKKEQEPEAPPAGEKKTNRAGQSKCYNCGKDDGHWEDECPDLSRHG